MASHYSRTTDFTETKNGLLKKLSELFNEVEGMMGRLAEIKNDVQAFDKALVTLGYKGDLGADVAEAKAKTKTASRYSDTVSCLIVSCLNYALMKGRY